MAVIDTSVRCPYCGEDTDEDYSEADVTGLPPEGERPDGTKCVFTVYLSCGCKYMQTMTWYGEHGWV